MSSVHLSTKAISLKTQRSDGTSQLPVGANYYKAEAEIDYQKVLDDMMAVADILGLLMVVDVS